MRKHEMTAKVEQESGLVKLTYDEAVKIKPGDKVFPNVKHMRGYLERTKGNPFHTLPVMMNDNLTFSVMWKPLTVTHARWNACYITVGLREELSRR